MAFLAHIHTDHADIRREQTAAEHCRNTAKYARNCLTDAVLGSAGYLAGLTHDCGKFKQEFLDYLQDPNGVRGSVNHTFAGCRLLLELFHSGQLSSAEELTAELLAFAVGSHHGQFDCVDENGTSGFLHRISKTDIHFSESKTNFLKECASQDELSELFCRSHEELTDKYQKLALLASDSSEEYYFYLGLLARLLLSAVIEGDRRDTAEFMGGDTGDSQQLDMAIFWSPYLHRIEHKISCFSQNTPINRARRQISDQCRSFAEQPGGIYRLNVPTGAGKTLSALRYAVAHAMRWGKHRLIFTSPLLSILEQNASVLRDYLEDDSIILEHHSNVIRTEETNSLDPGELATESWNAPVIITTLVQLMNTLFDGKTTSIRRFQGLCNSVIVIDEVQTVPPKMLTLFNLAVNFLAEICGATVLLCSATQPCLEQTEHPLQSGVKDIVPYDRELWEPFRRTVITDAGRKTFEEIADFSRCVLEEADSLLVICNKKDEADHLYQQLKGCAEISCHLSASMCVAHRRKTLDQMKYALAHGKKCLCVSTQVIEAGVDISFARVIRLSAGMDSVIQAAGRCNRHGEIPEPVPVYVVPYLGEKLGMLREIQDAKNASDSLLEAFRRNPERFDHDLSSDKAIGWYYRKLYSAMPAGYQDFPVKKNNKKTTLFELLSCNLTYCDEDAPYVGVYMLTQAFKLAGSLFQVFDNDTRDLVVPYGEGEALIAELTSCSHPDPGFLHAWEKRARPYTVSVYDWQLQKLGSAVTEYAGIAILSPGFYDEETGLTLRPTQNDFLEV